MPRRRKAIAAAIAIFALGIGLGATGKTFSAFTSTTANPVTLSSAADWTPPVTSAAAVGKATGGTPAGGKPGAVKLNRTFYAYANVAPDTGNPASGINTVTANLSGLNGQSAVALTTTGGPWTVDGTTYNYRSALQTATSAAGNSTYSTQATVTDLAANSGSFPFSVAIDNTVPSAADVQITNGTGTAKRADQNDLITLTFSEAIDPYTVIPATSWNGTTVNVVVRLLDGGGGNDSVQIWNAANSTQLNLGSISLGSTGYNTSGSTITFGASGTASSMQQSGSTITITLGTQSAAAQTVAATTTSRWTPSASAFDPAGNAMSTTARNELGAADTDF